MGQSMMVLPTEPFSTSRMHVLQYVDVAVCATNASDHGYKKHINYMVQVNEVGKGHWVVPRRYTQFRMLWRSVQTIAHASKVKPAPANAAHVGQRTNLADFDFPKKTLKVLFVGTNSMAASVIQARVGRFHTYLSALVRFLLDFQWGEDRRHQNAITSRDATKLCWLVANFLGVPKAFRTSNTDYLHSHPLCTNSPAAPCHKFPLVHQPPPIQPRHSMFKPKASSQAMTWSRASSDMTDVANLASNPANEPFRKQKSKSDPHPHRPSVWMESMRSDGSAHSDIFSMPMLGDAPDSPRDTIILGE
ncbi:hypothetical protein DYB28_004373 [Aphanomyces astaci]|uniref:PX domain-containing protein n=1 Tax=Aphanomyces astaci TaxID=112090 RepID=A0A9X8HGQ0_APHAT|nr:hypothetical protein DYB28_004373 [Aphanomyces astaci]